MIPTLAPAASTPNTQNPLSGSILAQAMMGNPTTPGSGSLASPSYGASGQGFGPSFQQGLQNSMALAKLFAPQQAQPGQQPGQQPNANPYQFQAPGMPSPNGVAGPGQASSMMNPNDPGAAPGGMINGGQLNPNDNGGQNSPQPQSWMSQLAGMLGLSNGS